MHCTRFNFFYPFPPIGQHIFLDLDELFWEKKREVAANRTSKEFYANLKNVSIMRRRNAFPVFKRFVQIQNVEVLSG
jgi:hypothetical protein